MGYHRGFGYGQWGPYVSVAERRQLAEKYIAALRKKGAKVNPVVIEGRTISKTFWGKAWCDNLESYSDFEYRLQRGRSYVRNGSVIDLQITKGTIVAQVMGSLLYHVEISIRPMAREAWEALVKACSGKIDSLIELLQGKFSNAVMGILTEAANGLFPKPREIEMRCSCLDGAVMCKHVAAALYGVGAFLDEAPEHLFQLRHVDHLDLLSSAQPSDILTPSHATVNGLEESELSQMFGIELDTGASNPPISSKPPVASSEKKISKKKKVSPKTVPEKAKKGRKSATAGAKAQKSAPSRKKTSTAARKVPSTSVPQKEKGKRGSKKMVR